MTKRGFLSALTIHQLFPVLVLFAALLLAVLPAEADVQPVLPPEQCDNGIDDDFDGLIDLNDPDCECEVVEPVSLIPNPSFEEMDCCPSNRSQLDCASSWIQASEPTTDFIHSCGWFGWNEFPPPLPFPDGEGIMGFRDGRVIGGNNPERNWKEYAGACLLSPLENGNSYRFRFHVGFVNAQRSPPINISFFGTPNCDNLPFGVGNEELGCPINGPGWVRLGSTLVSGGTASWVSATIDVVPTMDIAAIAIGPDCPGVLSPVSTYYFFDNLVLADFNSFGLLIEEISHPCADDFTIGVPLETGLTYQWYKDGVAIEGEMGHQLSQMYGEGDYQVRLDNGTNCRVSVRYDYQIPVIYAPMGQTICEDEIYQFGDRTLSETGIYVDTLKSVDNCDSVITLYLDVLGRTADTVRARIFEGESYAIDQYRFRDEGDHLITLTSREGCDSLVLLQLAYYHLFIPNVFSPNLDGINDQFQVFSETGLLQSSELTIYDRWGGKVYTGEKWDGRFEGDFVNPGVFVYVARVVMENGDERQFSGSVTVIR